MKTGPNRIPPGGSPADFETFRIASPAETHTRPATCAEVECSPHAKGWRTTVLAGSDLEDVLRAACRGEVDGHRRQWTARIAQENGFVQYVFPPGQTCLKVSTHRAELERPALFLKAPGDWRAFLGSPHVYDRPDQWADDLHSRTDQQAHLRNTRG